MKAIPTFLLKGDQLVADACGSDMNATHNTLHIDDRIETSSEHLDLPDVPPFPFTFDVATFPRNDIVPARLLPISGDNKAQKGQLASRELAVTKAQFVGGKLTKFMA